MPDITDTAAILMIVCALAAGILIGAVAGLSLCRKSPSPRGGGARGEGR